MLLKRDQQCVTQPDYEIPFTDKRDAVERLMKYHILRDRNDMNFEEFDNEFCDKASVLLDKFHGMVSKYRSLLLKESMVNIYDFRHSYSNEIFYIYFQTFSIFLERGWLRREGYVRKNVCDGREDEDGTG